MKQEEKTKRTRERIIGAGIKEFGAKGYKASSVTNISNSGIAKGLIYHNFESKDELYLECLKICFAEIIENLFGSEADIDHKKYFERRLKFFNEKKDEAAMVLEALIDPPEKLIEEIAEIRRPYDNANSRLIRNILTENSLRKNIDMDSAMEYISFMQDMFNWYCCKPKFHDRSFESSVSMHEENLEKLFEYMLYGVLKGD